MFGTIACLSAYMSVYLSICLSVCLSSYLPTCMYICVTLASPTWPQEVLSGSVRGQVLCLGLGRLRYLSLSLKRLNLSAPCILHNSSYFVPWQNCTKTQMEIAEHFKISRWAQDCFSCKPTTVSRENFQKFLKFFGVQFHP